MNETLMGIKYHGESKKARNHTGESERHECSVINTHPRLNFVVILPYLLNHPFEQNLVCSTVH